MARKTFEVEAIKNWVNTQLASPEHSVEVKLGMAVTLETILTDTGNYKGFNYLEQYDANDPEFAPTGIKNLTRKYH